MPQVIDVEVMRKVTELALPGRACGCCGEVTFVAPPPGAHAGSVSYGAVLNAAAVVLTAFGNVPPRGGRAGDGDAAGRAGAGGLGGQVQRRLAATPSVAGCAITRSRPFLFTRDFTVDWTTNVAERGAKAAKRHQAVSGYWHALGTLARWCTIRCYLDSAAARGIATLGSIRDALTGNPWLPPLPAVH